MTLSTEYVAVQTLILHVLVDQYSLIPILAVKKELNKVAMPEL